MVEYYIEAIDQQGRPQTLTLSAKNSTMADELVRSQGLQPTFITHAKAHDKDRRETAAQRKRRRVFGTAGAGLVAVVLAGGFALWLYIQRLETQRGFTLDAVRMAAADAGAANSVTGGTPELEGFARDLFGAMHLKFPGLLRSVNVRSENLMFIGLHDGASEKSPDFLRPVARVMALGLHEGFGSDPCTVLLIENGVTVADGRYANGETSVNLHIEETPES